MNHVHLHRYTLSHTVHIVALTVSLWVLNKWENQHSNTDVMNMNALFLDSFGSRAYSLYIPSQCHNAAAEITDLVL